MGIIPDEVMDAVYRIEKEGLPYGVGFDMTYYAGDKVQGEGRTDCGCVGCLIGVMSYYIPKKISESWMNYGLRILNCDCNTYNYLTSSDWYITDNTLEGAIARIKYVNYHGLPDDWGNQLLGIAPLSYKDCITKIPRKDMTEMTEQVLKENKEAQHVG